MTPTPLSVNSWLWFAWLACWSIAALNVKATRQSESIRSRLSHMLPLAVAFILIFGSLDRFELLNLRLLPPGDATGWAGDALTAAGLLFSAWARVHLGRNWSGRVTLKEDHSLIRSGPYRWVRHPIYTGFLAGILGSGIACGELRGAIAVALTLAAFLQKIRIEERILAENFGEEFARYRAGTSALIPFVI